MVGVLDACQAISAHRLDLWFEGMRYQLIDWKKGTPYEVRWRKIKIKELD